jgi:trigger factor
MAETATQERQNTVTITDAGPSRKKLVIEVPAETVSEKLRESMDALSTEAELPGFRRGHAPRRLIEKRFGTGVRSETKNQLVASAYTKAVEDHKLRVIGEPVSESLPKVELKDGQPLSFEVEVEVLPEFTVPSLDGIPVKKPLIEITDAMVDDELRKIAINEGSLEQRESAEPGDYLTGHAVMTGKDGANLYDINGAVVQVPTTDKNGKGMILGIMVDDFSKQLGLPKPGDTVTIKTTGPENHEVEAVRGADLTITFKVDRADRILALPMAEILTRFGMEKEDQLREAIRTRMTQRGAIEQQSVMRQQIAQHLIDNTQIELPERATAIQAARTLESQRMELMYRGVQPQQIEEKIAELRASSQQTAVRELKLFFILARVAEDFKVAVSDAEINGRIAQIAAENNSRPEKLRQDLIQQNRIGILYQQIRDHKAMDAILAKAKVTEVALEEYNKQAKADHDARSKSAAAEGKAEPKGKKKSS